MAALFDKGRLLTGTQPVDSALSSTSEFPVQNKVVKQNFDSITTTLNSKVNTSDIKNNLTSTDTDKPLSAYQGKVLDDKITTVSNNLTNILNRNLYTVTGINGFIVDYNGSRYINDKVVEISVTGHCESDLTDQSILQLNNTIQNTGKIFVIGTGTNRWRLNGVTYGYLGSGFISILSIPANTYLHINVIIILS